MSYIEKNLLPDEKILFRTGKSLIMFTTPAVWVLIASFVSGYVNLKMMVDISLIFWAVALVSLLYTWFQYQFSEFAVTDRRVMMREGFFIRHTNETRLNAISQVNVAQNIVGQLFNFGTVTINAFGATDSFDLLSRPVVFQRYVNAGANKG